MPRGVSPEEARKIAKAAEAILKSLSLVFPGIHPVIRDMRIIPDIHVETAAVDPRGRIHVNPHFWKKLDTRGRVATIIHEVMHYLLGHTHFLGRVRSVPDIVQNIIADALIWRIGERHGLGRLSYITVQDAFNLLTQFYELSDVDKQRLSGLLENGSFIEILEFLSTKKLRVDEKGIEGKVRDVYGKHGSGTPSPTDVIEGRRKSGAGEGGGSEVADWIEKVEEWWLETRGDVRSDEDEKGHTPSGSGRRILEKVYENVEQWLERLRSAKSLVYGFVGNRVMPARSYNPPSKYTIYSMTRGKRSVIMPRATLRPASNALILILDTSGSMSDPEVANLLLNVLRAGSSMSPVVLVAFDVDAEKRVYKSAVDALAELSRGRFEIAGGGGTDPSKALNIAVDETRKLVARGMGVKAVFASDFFFNPKSAEKLAELAKIIGPENLLLVATHNHDNDVLKTIVESIKDATGREPAVYIAPSVLPPAEHGI